MKNKKQNTQRFSIGDVAKAANVSVHTIRLWEKQNHFTATRTPGGQRVYTDIAMRKAVEHATAQRRSRQNTVKLSSLNRETTELIATGARIKGARLARDMTQAKAAEKIGISRSFLATVERGESGVSVQILARMADVFSIPMSAFSGTVDATRRVMRAKDRPRTVLAGGVAWEELAQPGSFDLEPALLYVPAGQSSGGMIVRPGEGFAFVMQGSLTFEFGDTQELLELKTGDAVIIRAGTPYLWCNNGKKTVTCVWLELVAPILGQKSSKPNLN
jgi:transcriptional regulator with XRE-family HTH domain